MVLKRKGSLIPVKGIDLSKPQTFIDDRAGFPTNMRFYKSEWRKREGRNAVTNKQTDDASQIMGYGKLELATVKHLVRASKKKFEKYNTSNDTWDNITSVNQSGGDEDFFFFCTVTESGLLIATNGVDSIKKYPGSGLVQTLGGSPGLAKYCCYLSPYVLLAYLTEGGDVLPWKVKWCDTDNPEEWVNGNAGAQLLSDEPSPIQNIMKLNDFVAVYKKESLWIGSKVATSDIFLFEPIKTGIGLAAPRCVVDAVGLHYFMGNNDFYYWNGIRETSIGGPIREYVFERLNRTKINRCFGLHVEELGEVWFFIVIAGYDWPTEIWKYNYRQGFWSFDTCTNMTSAIKWERFNTESWDDDTGPWDAAQDKWDAGTALANWEDIVLGDADGYSHRLDYTTTDDNGIAVSASIVTKDWTGDVLEFDKRWQLLKVFGKGPGYLFVDYSIDEGTTWVNVPFTSASAGALMDGVYRQYDFWHDVIAPQIRYRLRNSNSGETFYLRNLYPFYMVMGEVRA